MLKKFVIIKNVSRFKNFSACGDIELKRHSLLFAENGRGKTTLCAVVPSINSSCMRLANFLQPECFGRLHVGRFKSRRRLYSGVEV